MRPDTTTRVRKDRREAGFTLVEVAIGVGVLGVTILALYLAFSQGFAIVQVARENLRATQVLQEKTETIRLYTWDQLTTPGFIPATFTAPFYAVGGDTNAGLTYEGRMTISDTPLTESYAADMKEVSVELTWRSGAVTRNRTMTTFVSRYGLHNYIY
jgi:type II secretory pathway pseudopilin PulG